MDMNDMFILSRSLVYLPNNHIYARAYMRIYIIFSPCIKRDTQNINVILINIQTYASV